jgi:alpha-glucuronidase
MIRTFTCNIKNIFILMFLLSSGLTVSAEDGYDTWLRYKPVSDQVLGAEYIRYCGKIYVYGESDIISSSVNELTTGFRYMLGIKPVMEKKAKQAGIVLGVAENTKPGSLPFPRSRIQSLNNEGYLIKSTGRQVFIISRSETGLLYGTFHLLRLMQMNVPFSDLDIMENPGIRLRLLNHWDNPGNVPDGQPPVERGYSGGSIFKWQNLPALNNRYTDYARMLASIGINGTVINNVNTLVSG